MTFEELKEELVDQTSSLLFEARSLDKNSPEFGKIMEQVRLNFDKLATLEKNATDATLAYESQEIDKGNKAMDLNERRKDRWVQIGIAAGTLLVTEGVRILLFKCGFSFETENSVTSTFFRTLINSITRKS